MTRSTSPTPRTRRARVSRPWVALASALALALVWAGPAAGAGSASTEVPLAVGGGISGTVTSSDGPVVGAWVRAHATAGGGQTVATTAADGTYHLTGLAAGTYRVEFDGRWVFHAAEYYDDAATWAAAELVTVAGVDVPGIDAVLAEAGTISGTATGPGGPAEGVYVSADEQTTRLGTAALTDADGHYVLRGLPAGEYTVKFDARETGLVSEYYDNHLRWADADAVTVTLGADTGGIDAALALGGGIAGTVTGPSGPLASVWVGASNDTYYDGTFTAADGTYQLVGLPAGSYSVHFNAVNVGLVSEYYDGVVHWSDADPVVVATGLTTVGINAALVAGGTISGVVTGPTGPVEGASAWVNDPEGGGQGHASTDATGSYTIVGLAPGSYEVWFEGPSGAGLRSEYYDNQVTPMTATLVVLADQQNRTGINAVLALETDPLFPDVPHTAPFHAEIEWLANMGVTSGFPDGGFHPSAPVERQAMAAFLYRYDGEPAFTPPATPSFTDVPVGSPFYTEVEWLAATGITTGWPDGTFRPTATVERQAMAAFLYRFAEEPSFTPPPTATFRDVPTSAFFFDEVEWLADTEITTGWPDGTFRPTANVERQAMAAFLMRFDAWMTSL